MITSVEGWVGFLRDSHFVGGVPLVAAGVGLMLFGWRMWKASVVLAFAVIGTIAAAHFVEPGPNQWATGLRVEPTGEYLRPRWTSKSTTSRYPTRPPESA